jgi:hypothetical protein
VGEDYGVSLAAPPRDGIRPLPFVSRGCRPLLHSRSVPRLIEVLDAHLSALAHPSVPGLLRFDRTAALVLGDRACLVPQAFVERGAMTDRALQGSALRVADWPAPLLDPRAGTLVIRPPLGQAGPALPDDHLASPGSYELRQIYWPAGDPYPFESDARSLVTLLRRVTDYGDMEAQAVLESLVLMLARTTTEPLELTERASWAQVEAALA